MFKLFEELRSIGNVFRHLYESFSEAAEMLEVLDEPHEVIDHSHKAIQVDSGKIEFKHVNFNYAGDKPIFQDLDLRIKAGEKVAIVGESGS
ncbi:ABC transporter ATP-binding protein [Candidatus Roizmanbacteria bacterium]|nr:ABC transporter ATP-binding protein [Candidatus Roizmanbacteria bacterium]